MSEESGKCDICQKPATHKCGGCHETYYCGKEHQKAGWKVHKKICKPFKVSITHLLNSPKIVILNHLMNNSKKKYQP